MGLKESEITNQIRLAVSQIGVVLFRNNRGMFWTLDKKRKTRAGLAAAGSSDLIGWTKVIITADMVGKPVAIFTAIEVKTSIGRVSPDQEKFVGNVRKAGGIAHIARSEEEAILGFSGYRTGLR